MEAYFYLLYKQKSQKSMYLCNLIIIWFERKKEKRIKIKAIFLSIFKKFQVIIKNIFCFGSNIFSLSKKLFFLFIQIKLKVT